MSDDLLRVGKHAFRSRLFIGTGKYKDVAETRAALEASGAEVITVALRRVNLGQREEGSLMGLLTDPARTWKLLPNTAGCYTVDDAVRTCRLGRELGLSDMVKLEVIGDEKTLFPDNEATLEAAKILVAEGFCVLPYCTDDPIVCRKLQDIGCAAVMPLAAPIGSGLGIRNPHNLAIILEQARVPVIVDAGVGTASDAAVAMELGCDGVLMNTAIAGAKKPVLMAEAMREAVSAGRKAFVAGRIPRKLYASASSPVEGRLGLAPRAGATCSAPASALPTAPRRALPIALRRALAPRRLRRAPAAGPRRALARRRLRRAPRRARRLRTAAPRRARRSRARYTSSSTTSSSGSATPRCCGGCR
jgi:thiazole synthase